jgi:hypothetical protein
MQYKTILISEASFVNLKRWIALDMFVNGSYERRDVIRASLRFSSLMSSGSYESQLLHEFKL